MQSRSGVDSEDFLQEARKTLFVEGSGSNAIDPIIIGRLLEGTIEVKHLGSSYNGKAVAAALHEHHPEYYFLIDKDHHSDETVENYWKDFPNPEKSNILMWRRKELENYFLEPEYLGKSDYIDVSIDELCQKILTLCNKRLYLDTVNLVIVSIREKQKNTWINIFNNQEVFQSKDEAIRKLREHPSFAKRKESIAKKLSPSCIDNKFDNILTQMTGGKTNLEYGQGDWIKLINGKAVLEQVINSECFKVTKSGKQLQGKRKNNIILKTLVRKPLKEQPEDFQRLHELIKQRVLSRV